MGTVKLPTTVKEFLRMTAPQKMKLYQNNRDLYNKLAAATKETYDPDTDEQALADLTANPKTKSLISKGE